MKWSWKLVGFRSISVYMHALFLILIAVVVFSYWSASHSLAKTLEVVGIPPSRDLMVALQQRGIDAIVGDVMRCDCLSADAVDMLDAALVQVQTSECCTTAPVMQRDKQVGLLTAENVREFLLIAAALGERRTQKVALIS